MLREARFTVPHSVWETIDPDGSLALDGLDWTLYDSDDKLVDFGSSANLSHSPVDRGERFVVTYDVDVPEDPGSYELYIEIMEAYSYTEIIEKMADEYESDDHYTLDGSVDVAVDASRYGKLPVPWTLYRRNGEERTGEISDAGTRNIRLTLDSQPSLDPHALVVGRGTYTDHRIFHINPSILSVVRDMRTRLDRLNRRMRIDSLQFADSDYLVMMGLGRDRFNAVPPVTDFRMTDATGPIRSYWLDASMIDALRTRYLEESMTQYDYSGAGVNLTVDVTQALESLASTMETRLEQATQTKNIMANRGLVSGSGRWSLRNRNTGVIGVTLGPVTGHRRRGALFHRLI